MKISVRNLLPLVAGLLVFGLPAASKAQEISSLSVTPATVSGGGVSAGKVTLKAAATAEVKVLLKSNDAVAVVPASVTVPKGGTSVTFTVSTTNPTKETKATLTGTDPKAKTATAVLTVLPAIRLKAVTVEPTDVIGGTTATGKVVLTGKAGANGLIVKLASDKDFATVPATVTVASGAESATFSVTTKVVTAAGVAKITGTDPLRGAFSANLTVGPAPKLKEVKLEPASVVGGLPVVGGVALTGKAPKGGLTVTLSSDQTFAKVPASVVVLEGKEVATFEVKTTVVTAEGTAKITATDPKSNKSVASLVVKVVPSTVKELTLAPTSVLGGVSSQGSIVLTKAAPTGGLLVKLSSDKAAAKVPASVTVAAGATKATFTITTVAVTAETKASIEAKDPVGPAVKATLTLTAPAPVIKIKELLLDPKSVIGGGAVKGTVILTGKAPAAGIKIKLVSSNVAASLAPDFTITSGLDTGNFSIQTKTVSVETKVTITATDPLNNALKGELTVTVPKLLIVSMNSRRRFEPSIANVQPGTIIEWVNDDPSMAHAVNPDLVGVVGPDSETKFPSGMVPGDKYRWQVPFDLKPGKKIYYRCKYHAIAGDGSNLGSGMVGVIVIQ